MHASIDFQASTRDDNNPSPIPNARKSRDNNIKHAVFSRIHVSGGTRVIFAHTSSYAAPPSIPICVGPFLYTHHAVARSAPPMY